MPIENDEENGKFGEWRVEVSVVDAHIYVMVCEDSGRKFKLRNYCRN